MRRSCQSGECRRGQKPWKALSVFSCTSCGSSLGTEQLKKNHTININLLFECGRTCVNRKQILIINMRLDPIHQQGHVLRRRQCSRFLVLVSVGPEVFVLGASGHGRTRLVRALVAHGAVNEIDPVEEVHHWWRALVCFVNKIPVVHTMNSNPVIRVLPARELYCWPEVDSRAQRSLRVLVQRVPHGAWLKLFLGSKCLDRWWPIKKRVILTRFRYTPCLFERSPQIHWEPFCVCC